MDIEFIQEQLDNLATWGGAVEDIWGAIEALFGEGEESGALANLSSSLETDAPDTDVPDPDTQEPEPTPGDGDE